MKGTRIRDQLRRKVKHSAKPSTDTDDSEGSKAEIHYSDENISFKDITPFSPNPQQLRDNEQENWSDDQSSKVSDDVSDDEWEDEGFKGARRKLKGDGKSEKTTKKFLKENTLYDIAISDAVKDETMIESVENILKLFPDMFVKAYCRYVYEEQNEDTSKIVYKKCEAVKVMAKKAPAQKSKCASEKPFNCSDCDRSYIKKRGLTAHWKAKKHGPHTERVWSESDYENTARVENGEPGVSPTPEFTRSFNTLAQCNEVNMYDLDSLEVNKQPLLLDKCTVNDGMETDSSDEESAMYICL
ncbi:Zinc finger protein 841 [Frankliniella fusca]|uniref:Zinc finger protein 841 n=1 Tax=Frankliniella fusca TaxID=407009 RepID=A0AAE1LJK4_9NEOP|nr:Zinc finger protein 841 [Frankliniella fusca]